MASTNKTTNYELSQYVGTDKPTYLGDYNSDMLKIDTAIHGVAENVGTESSKINIIENNIGTMSSLQTTDKTSVVNAINEVNTNVNANSSNIGTLTNLETTDKTTIVNAINEVENKTIVRNILWANANPTSDFASQTIDLSSSDYDMYEIIYEQGDSGASYNVVKTTGKILKGKGTIMDFVLGLESGGIMQYRWRIVSYNTDTKLDFSVGNSKVFNSSSLSAPRNDILVPLYVIGYKTDLFN